MKLLFVTFTLCHLIHFFILPASLQAPANIEEEPEVEDDYNADYIVEREPREPPPPRQVFHFFSQWPTEGPLGCRDGDENCGHYNVPQNRTCSGVGNIPCYSFYPASYAPTEEPYYYDCHRNCSADEWDRRSCKYTFVLHQDVTLGGACGDCPNRMEDCRKPGCVPGDGIMRPISVVNGMMPGPSIRVCEGDTVVVDVINQLAENTSIHWHGIHQKGSQWMDGVPRVTQCDILPGHSFRYNFDTPVSGTYFWHSHSGYQRGDGIYGSLIVRRAEEKEPYGRENGKLYDFDLPEHEMIVMDWLYQTNLQNILSFRSIPNIEFRPRNILINGLGIPQQYFWDFDRHENIQSKGKAMVPIHEVRIRKGHAYRLRLICNGVMSCPVEMSVENHTMQVIASDGFDVTPITVDSLVLYAGERWDVVIHGNRPVGSYWIKFRGLNLCRYTGVYQVAILNYEGVPVGNFPRHSIKKWAQAAPPPGGLQLNPPNFGPGVRGASLTAAELTSLKDDDPEIIEKRNPDHQFYVTYDFNPIDHLHVGHERPRETVNLNGKKYTPQLNFISNMMPPHPPLVYPEEVKNIEKCSQSANEIDRGLVQFNQTKCFPPIMETGCPICDQMSHRSCLVHYSNKNCSVEYCPCSHWLKVGKNSIVEIILIDKGLTLNANHPFHLHGHSFRVLGMARLNESTSPEVVQHLDRNNLLPRRRSHAPIKDTVTVPDGGYTILRFRADNPGFWYLHCHIEYHVEVGMGLILQVGDISEIPAAPFNLRTCSPIPPSSGGGGGGGFTPFGGELGRGGGVGAGGGGRATFTNPIDLMLTNPSIFFNQEDGFYYWPLAIGQNIVLRRNSMLTENWAHASQFVVYTAPAIATNLENPRLFKIRRNFYIYFNMKVNFRTRLYVIEAQRLVYPPTHSRGYVNQQETPVTNYNNAVRLVPPSFDWIGKDPTVFEHVDGQLYIIWAGRTDGTDSKPIILYLARMESPTKIGHPTVPLVRPASDDGALECPQILRQGTNKLMLFFTDTQPARGPHGSCVTMLELEGVKDPTDLDNWETQVHRCAFRSSEVHGVYSLGRFAVTLSTRGQSDPWIVYQASSGRDQMGNVRAQPLFWNSTGSSTQPSNIFPLTLGLGTPIPVPRALPTSENMGAVYDQNFPPQRQWPLPTAMMPIASSEEHNLDSDQVTMTTEEPLDPALHFLNPIEPQNLTPSIFFYAGDRFYYWPIVREDGRSLFVRKSRKLTNWVNAAEKLVYRLPPSQNNSRMAGPTISKIYGKFYIYFHTQRKNDPKFSSTRMYVMRALNSTNRPDSNYHGPVRLIPHDRDWFAKDATVMKMDNGQLYLLWTGRMTEFSERPHVLYIAQLKNPTEIQGPTTLLRRPVEFWEGVWGVNEGPKVVGRGGKKFLLFSINEKTSDQSCIAMMELGRDQSPVEPANWIVADEAFCVFGMNDVEDVYSIGEFSLTYSPNGRELWLVYEARAGRMDSSFQDRREPTPLNGGKNVRAQKVDWDSENGALIWPKAHGLGFRLAVPAGQTRD